MGSKKVFCVCPTIVLKSMCCACALSRLLYFDGLAESFFVKTTLDRTMSQFSK